MTAGAAGGGVTLVDVDVCIRYQMQTWRHEDACTCGLDWNTAKRGHKDGCPYPTTTRSWVPMEHGTAPNHWKPKRDAREAVKHAGTWAGAVWGIGIPAMQVVELPSGRVVWRDSHQYPAAGEPVAPPWQDEVYAAAKAEYDARRTGQLLAPDHDEQGTLW